MNRRGKITILLVLVLLAFVMFVMFHSGTPKLRPQSFTLSDGSTMTMFKMTYGTKHEIVYGNGWQEHIAQFIPARYRTNFGLASAAFVPPVGLSANKENIVVWMRRSGKLPAATAGGAMAIPRMNAEVVDDLGVQANISLQYWNGTLLACYLPSYPRRSATIHFRVTDGAVGGFPVTGGKVLANLEVPNPDVNTSPPLTADSPPLVWKSNDFEVTLTKLETGSLSAVPAPPLRVLTSTGTAVLVVTRSTFTSGNVGSHSTAFFDFRDRGHPASNWQVLNLTVSSPSSPPKSEAETSSGYIDQSYFYEFDDVLWPEEPVWQITAQMGRTSDFSSNELWTIHGIPVPQTNVPTSLAAVTNVHGVTVLVHTLAWVDNSPPSSLTTLSGGTRAWGGKPVLRASVSVSSANTHVVLYGVANDLGEKVDCAVNPANAAADDQPATASPTAPASWQFDCTYPPLDHSKTIDLTFAISKSYLATFRVKPAVATQH